MSTVKRQIKRLPSIYNRKEDSNNYKLLFIPAYEIDQIYDAHGRAKIWRLNLSEAMGKTLDYLGQNIQQPRDEDDDVDYRMWLQVKRIANLSKGEIESYNKALILMMQDSFIGLYETWKSFIYLNQEDPTGLRIGADRWFLTGMRYDEEPAEPAAVVVEFDHQKYWDLVGEYYKDIIDRIIYLDGKNPFAQGGLYLWQNEIVLDGGYTYTPEDIDAMLITTMKIREMMHLIKSGGVGLYWRCHTPFYGLYDIMEDDPYSYFINTEHKPITQIGFGNEGHEADGTLKEPTGSEVEAYGEQVVIDVTAMTNVDEFAVIQGILGWDQMVDYNVSSIAFYDADGIVAIKNTPPAFKDDRTLMDTRWIMPHSLLYFNGLYDFDGEIDFDGIQHLS